MSEFESEVINQGVFYSQRKLM